MSALTQIDARIVLPHDLEERLGLTRVSEPGDGLLAVVLAAYTDHPSLLVHDTERRNRIHLVGDLLTCRWREAWIQLHCEVRIPATQSTTEAVPIGTVRHSRVSAFLVGAGASEAAPPRSRKQRSAGSSADRPFRESAITETRACNIS